MHFTIVTCVDLNQVALFTVAEMYNEEDTINHHGFERRLAQNSDQENSEVLSLVMHI